MSGRLQVGVPVRVADGVRRLLAPNAGMMTGPGTNTYLLGDADVTVIDPGPPIAAHVDAILNAAGGRIASIVVTHTHPDHSPAARLLASRCGAPLLGRPAPDGQHQDRTFVPDRVLEDGDRLDAPALRVLHTPGHASNHLCYLREADGLLFTGDHVINGSTVVIDPPDGDMGAYLASLARLSAEPLRRIAPGHGELLDEPLAAIDWLVRHRLKREALVVTALAGRPDVTLADLTAVVYAGVDAQLHPVAARSLLAHLLKLQQEGRAGESGGRWRLADD